MTGENGDVLPFMEDRPVSDSKTTSLLGGISV
jgi:hypothetical protein